MTWHAYLLLISLFCLQLDVVQAQSTPATPETKADAGQQSKAEEQRAKAEEQRAKAEELGIALGDVDLNKRRDAAYQLASMGAFALPALDALIEKLDDRDEQVWIQSVTAIAKIGPSASRAIEPLCETFSDRSVQKRYRAAWAVGKIGKAAIPFLRQKLANSSNSERIGAIEALGWISDDPDTAAQLLASTLNDSQSDVKRRTLNSLSRLGNAGPSVLTPALTDEDSQVKTIALRMLSKAQNLPDDVVKTLTELAGDADPSVRAAALIALGSGMKDKQQLIELLLTGIQTLARESRCCRTCPAGPGRANRACPPRLTLLNSEEPTVRIAARALGNWVNPPQTQPMP